MKTPRQGDLNLAPGTVPRWRPQASGLSWVPIGGVGLRLSAAASLLVAPEEPAELLSTQAGSHAPLPIQGPTESLSFYWGAGLIVVGSGRPAAVTDRFLVSAIQSWADQDVPRSTACRGTTSFGSNKGEGLTLTEPSREPGSLPWTSAQPGEGARRGQKVTLSPRRM